MPDTPPADPPAEEKKSLFEKLGAGLPVALTALATILAGMSTGELNRAMLWRSNAAQDQAKATGQWTLAGFKRDRALICDTTADTLRSVEGYRPPAELPRTQEPDGVKRVAEWLRGKGDAPAADEEVQAVLQAVREQRPEPEVLKLARRVDEAKLQAEIEAAVKQEADIEGQYEVEATAAKAAMALAKQEDRAGTTAARYEVDGRRYRAESTANQWVGFLLEVRVKHSTEESDRHRQRSENFFLAMLAAQIGAVGSSLALARKKRSVLWLVAGLAGLAATAFGAYVYLTM
jgi:hypothetical protein